MVYAKKLPELRDLCRIARAVDDFPASAEKVIKTARQIGYGDNVTDFLKLFPAKGRNGEFLSRADFYTRAAEVAMLICEEREQPKERLLSPQD